MFGRSTSVIGLALDELHDEVRAALWRRARIEHLGDVRMVHHGQRLPLGLEAGDDLRGVHSRLDDLERHLRRTGAVCSASQTSPMPPSPTR